MTRDEREQAIWHDAYMLAMSQDPHPTEASNWADAAVAEFRKRYPAEPAAPPAVWHDEPPFAKDGESYACWVDDEKLPAAVYFDRDAWYVMLICELYPSRLAGRRVSPIRKP